MADRQNLKASPMHACRSSWLSAEAVTVLSPPAKESAATIANETFKLEIITDTAGYAFPIFSGPTQDIYTPRPAAG
ncbi:MAG TPA: hypothetical protein VMF32_17670 [Xanthobacteraceae bacterium]|nr:hypothetical protein [Xanthobacteraceae bacterium]